MPNLFVAVAEAAGERKVPVALLIDELQYFSHKERSALIMAMHRMQQRQLPMVLLGAGLPYCPDWPVSRNPMRKGCSVFRTSALAQNPMRSKRYKTRPSTRAWILRRLR